MFFPGLKLMSRKTLLILAIVLVPVAVLVIAAAFGVGGWAAEIPNPHFVIAFAIGATATVLLSVGLFALVFISARRGYDDRAGPDGTDPDPGRDAD